MGSRTWGQSPISRDDFHRARGEQRRQLGNRLNGLPRPVESIEGDQSARERVVDRESFGSQQLRSTPRLRGRDLYVDSVTTLLSMTVPEQDQ
eukprot:3805189-Pyramimonas_sp.AAC.1